MRQPVKVTVFASLKLISEYLSAILASERGLAVINVAETYSELLQMASANWPDVVLLCLMDDEGEQISVIADLLGIAPDIKVVVLSGPNSNLDQPASVKLGVRGIVGTNQSVRVLVRAIQQVSEGDVWLNQKLVDRLLGEDSYSSNGNSNSHGKDRVNELTNRETEIVELVGRGMNNKEIAKQLTIGEATVRHHLSSVYSKLGVEDRLNLAIFAYQQGIVTPPARRR